MWVAQSVHRALVVIKELRGAPVEKRAIRTGRFVHFYVCEDYGASIQTHLCVGFFVVNPLLHVLLQLISGSCNSKSWVLHRCVTAFWIGLILFRTFLKNECLQESKRSYKQKTFTNCCYTVGHIEQQVFWHGLNKQKNAVIWEVSTICSAFLP